MTVIVGTAGWSIARTEAERFPAEGSALERYASRFGGVEINSSFHRPHRVSTWARWGEQVPDHFRFSVKVPKTITHKQKLVDCGDLLAAFLEESSGLGDKLAVLLVQLPPSLAFDAELAETFFSLLSASSRTAIACEPRHASWFEEEAGQLLEELRVARVAADPAKVPEAAVPGGWRGFSYFRLHGSPVPYRSSYEEERLEGYAALIRDDLEADRPVWCMFDNTASSAATGNALSLMGKLSRAG
jgi:uncharacterized protein YecE (DUF72 family)